jgi:hypothetical protein
MVHEPANHAGAIAGTNLILLDRLFRGELIPIKPIEGEVVGVVYPDTHDSDIVQVWVVDP